MVQLVDTEVKLVALEHVAQNVPAPIPPVPSGVRATQFGALDQTKNMTTPLPAQSPVPALKPPAVTEHYPWYWNPGLFPQIVRDPGNAENAILYLSNGKPSTSDRASTAACSGSICAQASSSNS